MSPKLRTFLIALVLLLLIATTATTVWMALTLSPWWWAGVGFLLANAAAAVYALREEVTYL